MVRERERERETNCDDLTIVKQNKTNCDVLKISKQNKTNCDVLEIAKMHVTRQTMYSIVIKFGCVVQILVKYFDRAKGELS